MIRVSTLLLGCLVLQGCYYMQAAAGQLEVMRKREPIVDVIKHPDTPAELRKRLQLIVEAREFSVQELGLPDNGSYRSYADLERDFVVWNVFAAPEFSLEPKRWCFPVAGCVSYRGYFKKEAAERKAAQLREDGYDVAVGGISAYSTLGNFNDPILNTMMAWDDLDLVGTLFHELAHQVVYVKGDSGFNESFATAVEEFGVKRWLDSRGNSQAFEEYTSRREHRQGQMAVVDRARDELEEIYSSGLSDDERRKRKSARIAALQNEIAAHAGGEAAGWLSGNINNAHLMSMTLYEGRLPEFRALFTACEEDIRCFYRRSRALAKAQTGRN